MGLERPVRETEGGFWEIKDERKQEPCISDAVPWSLEPRRKDWYLDGTWNSQIMMWISCPSFILPGFKYGFSASRLPSDFKNGELQFPKSKSGHHLYESWRTAQTFHTDLTVSVTFQTKKLSPESATSSGSPPITMMTGHCTTPSCMKAVEQVINSLPRVVDDLIISTQIAVEMLQRI